MIDGNTEIRKLRPGEINKLAELLDINGNWENVMANITSSESQNGDGILKYTAEDIRLIRQAGLQQGRSSTEIFLEEWGTSGKRRPTVRNLHEILNRVEQYRAADYVARNLLNETPPERDLPIDSSSTLGSSTSGFLFRNVSTVEYVGNGAQVDLLSQFNVESSNAVQQRFTEEEMNSVKLVKFREISAITKNFDPSTKLGEGGFGSVHLGNLDSKDVAIKKLNTYERESNLVDQFKNELELLSKCRSHPNILPLVAVSIDEVPCLIYEYMPNGSLDKRLTCKIENFPPLSWQKRIHIASDVSNGLLYLHTSFDVPLIHRDIKSANILLNSEDIAKIGDFGLVRKNMSMNTSRTAVYKGTAAYTAPEAFNGTISPKMDIFSFGVVLLELLTGSLGYNADRQDAESLVDYVDENIEQPEDFKELLDPKAGSWDKDVWTEMYNLSKKCTAPSKKTRPTISDVDLTITRLKENISQTIGL